MTEQRVSPPTEDQKRQARAALGPLTDTQRRAVYAVVAYEVAQELAEESWSPASQFACPDPSDFNGDPAPAWGDTPHRDRKASNG